MRIKIEIEPEMPVVNKVFFFIPLRPGLMAWGIIQLIINIIYGFYVNIDLLERTSHITLDTWTMAQLVFFFTVTMIWILVDSLLCAFLILGAQKKNGNFLEVSYDYLKVKLPLYAAAGAALVFVHCLFYSYNWFDRNFDGVLIYLVCEDPALLAVMWLSQLYLLVLVHSMIFSLGHSTDLKTLYQRLRKQDIRQLLSSQDDDRDSSSEPEVIVNDDQKCAGEYGHIGNK